MTTSPSCAAAATTTARCYAAYAAAVEHKGAPTVILAKTVKGWTLGPGIEGRNVTHQAKKLTADELKIFRDRLELPIPDDKLKDAPYYHPGPDAPGDPVHARAPADRSADRSRSEPSCDSRCRRSKDDRVQRVLRRVGPAGQHDDGLQPHGAQPRARPADRPRASCRSSPTRRAPSAWIRSSRRSASTTRSASATRRSTRSCCSATSRRSTASCSRRASPRPARWARSRRPAPPTRRGAEPMVPFYTFYSMFGMQRTGDQVWAFGDARGRGFMMGATAGRTTLTGEGLQHDDGHSHVLASDRARTSSPTTRPSPTSWRSSCARESTACTASAARTSSTTSRSTTRTGRMPAKPEGVDDGVLRGLYRLSAAPEAERRVQILASGPILLQAIRAQDMLRERFGVAADVWSATSFQQLRNEALDVERWNRLHPDAEQRVPYVRQCLDPSEGPIVAATDYMKAVPDMVVALDRSPVHRARHRWLRPLRHARGPAHPLRGQRRSTSPTRRCTRCASTASRRRTS